MEIKLYVNQHKGEERIFIKSPNKRELNKVFNALNGVKWSNTKKEWHMPLDEKLYKQFYASLKKEASINNTALKTYLQNKKKEASIENQAKPAQISITSKPKAPELPQQSIALINAHVLPASKQALVLKAYSPSTIKTYLNEISQFLHAIKHNAADEFSVDRIKKYLQYCYEKLNLSENTMHSRMNALKFYYEQVLKKEKFFWEIPRPKKHLHLPKLLNEEELRKLFNALTNKKHKAMLFTAYSAGLRVSEIVNLKISHIDSKRMQIFIEKAKGKKDRYVNLSPVLLDILRNYIKEYKPPAKQYLFESEQTFKPYPARTVQQVFNNAKHKAGIKKEVGIHSLRHSFATHLLDKGTDIRYIKDLLGHFDIKTTERYLHVSNHKLVHIISPLDDLISKEKIDW